MLQSILIITLFSITYSYYLACDSITCVSSLHIEEIIETIKPKYYSCYYDNFQNKREFNIVCYSNFYSLSYDIFNIKKCDNIDYEKISYKLISNEPSICTINNVPMYINNNFTDDNFFNKSKPVIRLDNLNRINKYNIVKEIQIDAYNKNAVAIVEYTETIHQKYRNVISYRLVYMK